VLTIGSAKLGHEHLRCAGVPRERLADVLVQGVEPGTEFVTRILGNQPQLNMTQAQQDVVATAMDLKARAPQLTTVVLECTNIPPYQAALFFFAHHQIGQDGDDLRKNSDQRNAHHQAAKKRQRGLGNQIAVFARHVLQYK
jgi:hypothetical protein